MTTDSSKPKILVIINPNSGNHKAISIFEKHKTQIENHYEIVIFHSQYPKHVLTYFNVNHDTIVNQYKLIVGVGGDGIIFEIINSMLKWDIRIPISEIPCGSGNGYFKSLTFENGVPNTVGTAIDLICSGEKKNVDVMHIKNLNLFCRLAISWGIISDIDIHTEWMRKIGELRFDLGALWYILKKQSYYGVLQWELEPSPPNKISSGDGSNSGSVSGSNSGIVSGSVSGNFVYFWACNVSHGSSNCHSAPGAKMDDGFIYISYVLDDVTHYELAKIAMSLSTGNFIKHPKVHYIKTRSFSLETNGGLLVIDGEPLNDINTIHVENKPLEIEILHPDSGTKLNGVTK
mgnify:CR=1 FL=1